MACGRRRVQSRAITGAPDPAMLNCLGMQGAEGVDEAAGVGQLAVEVVFERREKLVARLVAGFNDVEITEEDRRLPAFQARQGGVAVGQPFPLPLRFLDAGIAGGDVDTDDLNRPLGCGQSYCGSAGGKVADRSPKSTLHAWTRQTIITP